jgi:hypothetical protein
MLTNFQRYRLHAFCDACKSSYAAVVFLRCEDEGQVSVQILQAKSRVPRLKISIPRLELLVCCIGVRFLTFLKSGIAPENAKEFFWTVFVHLFTQGDERKTLSRVRWKSSEKIRSITKVTDWRYDPGQGNPANLSSRGRVACRLTQTKWWEGPSWPRLAEENCPSTERAAREEQINRDRTSHVLGRASLTYGVMSIICDCETTVNSRPLTYISEDSRDPLPLTQAMYLQHVPQVGVPYLDHLDNIDLTKRLR